MLTTRDFWERVREAAIAVQSGAHAGLPEESFRKVVERILGEHFSEWGIEFEPSLEKVTITRRRLDMLCGRVVTEYKAPGVLASETEFADAMQQAKEYIEDLAIEYAEPLDAYYGAVIDGFNIGFLHYDAGQGWIESVRLHFDEARAFQLLERYRAHSKHPLDARRIADALGRDSEPARLLVPALIEHLDQPTGKTRLLFSEWLRLFGQAVGTEARQYPEMVQWAGSLGVELPLEKSSAISTMFFAAHTYYALVIKLITAAIMETIRTEELSSLPQRLAECTIDERKDMLSQLEDNVLFEKYGINNFLEGDFFSWYLDVYDEQIDTAIARTCKILSRYEPATPLLSPSHVTDLFKHLYQYLVPDKIRHDLGEFYTPDWLADYVLQRCGFADSTSSSLMDPACGSGTFLVRALNMIREKEALSQIKSEDGGKYAKKQLDLLKHIQSRNLMGIDLNPLAVISARANLILALLDEMAEATDSIHLPIYLADSIYIPKKEDDKYVYRLQTEKRLMEMEFPDYLVEGPGFGEVLREVERFITEEPKISPAELPSDSLIVQYDLHDFYEQIWELDEDEWNRIWCRVVFNRFTSAVAGVFDFVVGNPPWVVWSNLPEAYRSAVKPVCDHYDLFSSDTWVGGIESDISTVLAYSSCDHWLKEGGTLAFLITQSVFKTRSAQGFRRFEIKHSSTPLKVLEVDDLVSIKPFEDAQNRTAIIFWRKGEKTEYPVPYLVWRRRKKGESIPTTASLAQVMRRVQIWPHEAAPAGSWDAPWVTATIGHLPVLLSLLGGKGLRARKGTTTDLNNVYWVQVLDRKDNLVLVENNQSTQGHQVVQRREWIEEELVYPLARGQELGRFHVREPELAVIVPQRSMRGYAPDVMQEKYPRALQYFEAYKDEACVGCSVSSACKRGLVHRASFANPKYGKGMGEYYAVWNVGAYTFAPFKVAWPEQGSSRAAVLGSARLNGLEPKVRIPDHKLMFIDCDTEEAAHYYCGILNSELVRAFCEAVSLTTSRGTRIFENMKIPDYNPDDPAHREIAELSKHAHEGRRLLDDEFEEELNMAVAQAMGHSTQRVMGPRVGQVEWYDPLVTQLREMVEKDVIPAVPGGDRSLRNITFVAVDLETTGWEPVKHAHRIIEIGAVKFDEGGIREKWSSLVWPNRPIHPGAEAVHGIRLDDLMACDVFEEVAKGFLEFIGDSVVVLHNAKFDASFMDLQLQETEYSWSPIIVDTLAILRRQFSLPSNRILDALKTLGVPADATHSALNDANATAHLLLRIIEVLRERTKLDTLNDLLATQGTIVTKLSKPIQPPDTVLRYINDKTQVRLEVVSGSDTVNWTCTIVGCAFGTDRGYYSLEFSRGRRICLRRERVLSIVPA